MPKMKLTAAAVSRIKAPTAGQVDYFDQAMPAFGLRVGKSSRSYFLATRINGRLARLTIGRAATDDAPGMTLAEARRIAGEWQAKAANGDDPREAKAREAEAAKEARANTFAVLADTWLKRDQAGNKDVDRLRRLIEREAVSRWAMRPAASITRHDCMRLIDGIADRGAATQARRVHAYLHRLFRWAVGRGEIEANPMAELPKPGAENPRDRVLSDAELARVWLATGRLGYPFGPAFRLLTLTAARREEIMALRWDEIDEEAGVIRLAGSRTKNGKPHDVPLSAAAMATLKALPRIAGGYVFTTTGKTPATGISKAKSRLDSLCGVEGWRLHDLRRTAATGLQRLGARLEVIEAALGHASGTTSGIVRVYQRHQYGAEKRAALEAWARHIEGLIEPAPSNVVMLAG